MFNPCSPCCEDTNKDSVCVSALLTCNNRPAGAISAGQPIDGAIVHVGIGFVEKIEVLDQGINYTTAHVAFFNQDFSNQSAITHVNIQGGRIISVDVIDGGQGYVNPISGQLSAIIIGDGLGARIKPTIALREAPGSPCTTDIKMISIQLLNAFDNGPYTEIPKINIDGNAKAIPVMSLIGAQVVNPGMDYQINNQIFFNSGRSTQFAGLRVKSVVNGGISEVDINGIGLYTEMPVNPAETTSGFGVIGKGATFNLTWRVADYIITDKGSGYGLTVPNITFDPPSGGGKAATGRPIMDGECCVKVEKGHIVLAAHVEKPGSYYYPRKFVPVVVNRPNIVLICGLPDKLFLTFKPHPDPYVNTVSWFDDTLVRSDNLSNDTIFPLFLPTSAEAQTANIGWVGQTIVTDNVYLKGFQFQHVIYAPGITQGQCGLQLWILTKVTPESHMLNGKRIEFFIEMGTQYTSCDPFSVMAVGTPPNDFIVHITG